MKTKDLINKIYKLIEDRCTFARYVSKHNKFYLKIKISSYNGLDICRLVSIEEINNHIYLDDILTIIVEDMILQLKRLLSALAQQLVKQQLNARQ